MRISDWSSDVCSSDLFVNFDAGQFLYEDDRVTGLIDFEASSFGDPAAELSGLRLRDAAEPLGDLSAMTDRYEMLTGDRIRSEERRVGKACVSQCRSRWSPYH